MTAVLERLDEIREVLSDPETPDDVIGALTEALVDTRYDWREWSRIEQRAPDGDWSVWLILAGRGWGKTRTGAEWLRKQATTRPGTRWAIVAPTYADARDTCVEGESGFLAVLPPAVRNATKWNRSMGEIELPNGSQVKLFGTDEPDRLRGPQHHGAWCDELAAWRYPDAWDQLQFGLRLGELPRTVVTTTPRPVPLITGDGRDGRRLGLMRRDTVTVTRGSTFDNAANLSAAALAELRSRYEGTRLGRQELHAEILDDVEGALWTRAMLDQAAVAHVPELVRTVVAIDPAVTSGETSDESGIVAAGLGTDGDVYVLADRSGRYSPLEWARRAVALYDEHEGDRIIGEVNNGGDLVEANLRVVEPGVPYKRVTASRGKRLRAEPVAALYEQGRVHHAPGLGLLEDQMTSWTPESGSSPDRLDALVWAITDLALGTPERTMRFRGAA